MSSASYTAKQMIEMLRRHYIPEPQNGMNRPGGVFAHEVAVNGTWGAAGSRRADALYAGFTSASGRILIGHEVKVSRADWRAELAQIEKADAWSDACHAWYIVAPSIHVVPPEELPHGWGLLTPPRTSRGRRFVTAVKAEVKTDHEPPWWAVRSFMARLDTLMFNDLHHRSKLIHSEESERFDRLLKERVQSAEGMTFEDRERIRALERIERITGKSISHYARTVEDRITPETLALAIDIAQRMTRGTWELRSIDTAALDLTRAARELTSLAEDVKIITERHAEAGESA